MSDDMTLLIVKAAPATSAGPALFAIVRDENYLLPFFFAYYRALGVELFVIYDDRSGPATVDFLMTQPDCAVLRSDHRFGDTFGKDRFGVDRRLPTVLKERAPEAVLPGRWVLTVDVDEFLILPPGCPNLVAFVALLERLEQPYATAPMVEFYAETLDHRNYSRSQGPFAGNPHFDAGPYYRWTGGTAPVRLGGGMRGRLLKRLCEEHPDRVTGVFGDYGPDMAQSWKAPLLKHGFGVVRTGDHEISVAPSPEVTAALAHFKLHPDLDAKIDQRSGKSSITAVPSNTGSSRRPSSCLVETA
jgi:hypothetical protein